MNLTRLAAAALLACAAFAAQALEIAPYSAEAFAKAQQAGAPVALHFHADWCPTCRAQQKAFEAFKAEPGLDLTLLVANYDTEQRLKQQHGVRMQSTLIVFKGTTETARVAGETAPEKLRATLQSAL